ncbi:hypothetical protein ACHAWF_004109 [Thalassiosira exigua]
MVFFGGIEDEAAAANETVARGVNAANEQAAAANATAARGVEAANHQANVANVTAARGVDVANHQAAVANETAARGVDAANEQAAAANATVSDAVNAATLQAAAANDTAARGVVAAESVMDDISDLLDKLADPLWVVATLVGPLQVLSALNLILTMLQNLNIIRGVQRRLLDTANDIKVEIGNLTDAVKGVRDVLQSGNAMQIVRNITGDNGTDPHIPQVDRKGKKIQCFAFFSSSRSCVDQLKGSKFWAYSSIHELFSLIYEFGSLSKISVDVDSVRLHLKVFFLDPQPEDPVTIPYFHFAGDSIEFISHSQKKQDIFFQRIFVARDSHLALEGVNVGCLVSLGHTKMVNCIVQHFPDESICAPPLGPAFVSIPQWQGSYSVGHGLIKYDHCSFPPDRKRTGIFKKVVQWGKDASHVISSYISKNEEAFSPVSNPFESKQSQRIVTSFCPHVCTITGEFRLWFREKLPGEALNPGGLVVFETGSFRSISITVDGPNAARNAHRLVLPPLGEQPNLLFVYADDGPLSAAGIGGARSHLLPCDGGSRNSSIGSDEADCDIGNVAQEHNGRRRVCFINRRQACFIVALVLAVAIGSLLGVLMPKRNNEVNAEGVGGSPPLPEAPLPSPSQNTSLRPNRPSVTNIPKLPTASPSTAPSLDPRHIRYGDQIYLQISGVGSRWLKRAANGNAMTSNYLEAGQAPEDFKWTVSSQTFAPDPELGNCVRYGDIVVFNADISWLDAGEDEVCSVKAGEIVKETRLRWKVRSTTGTGFLDEGNNVDPAHGLCVEKLNKIYLQATIREKLWLSGGRGSGQALVCMRNIFSEEYEKKAHSAYEWIVRKDDPGVGTVEDGSYHAVAIASGCQCEESVCYPPAGMCEICVPVYAYSMRTP